VPKFNADTLIVTFRLLLLSLRSTGLLCLEVATVSVRPSPPFSISLIMSDGSRWRFGGSHDVDRPRGFVLCPKVVVPHVRSPP